MTTSKPESQHIALLATKSLRRLGIYGPTETATIRGDYFQCPGPYFRRVYLGQSERDHKRTLLGILATLEYIEEAAADGLLNRWVDPEA